MQKNVLESVVAALQGVSFESLDGATVAKAKVVLLDGLGVALAGLQAEVSRIARASVRNTSQGGCTIWGTGQRADLMDAVLANSVPIHSYMHDDMLPESNTHPQSMLLPVAMALAEANGCSGAQLLLALVRGYEAIGLLGPPPLAEAVGERGFKAGSVFGTLGSAANAASLLGLDSNGTANALACAASMVCGLRAVVRSASMERCFQNAAAARSGLLATLLAQQGLEADQTIFDHPAGFAPTLGGIPQPEPIVSSRSPFILRVTHRPFPGVGLIAASTAGALQLVARHPVEARAISRIQVWVTPELVVRAETLKAGPFTSLEQALLSRPLAIAAVMRYKELSPAIYEAAWKQPEVITLARNVQVLPDQALSRDRARLEVTLADGQNLEMTCSVDSSEVYLDLPRAAAKFHRLASGVLERRRAEQVAELVCRIEELDDASEVVRLLAA